MSDPSDQLLPLHGGYRKMRSFQVAELVYDATLIFCDRFIEKRSRTHDQMVHAARSGKQNILEGSVASGTSKKGELKLTNVARASLEELMRDYQDFLRQRGLRLWPKDSPEALAVRGRYKSDSPDQSILSDVRVASAETAANTMLCLINQASYLLRRQLKRLEQDFLKNGGFTERLYAARNRAHNLPSDQSDLSDTPACPRCGNRCASASLARPQCRPAFLGLHCLS
jgi:four helix bundle suffix protein